MIQFCWQAKCVRSRVTVSDDTNQEALPVVCAQCKRLTFVSEASVKKTRYIPRVALGAALLALLVAVIAPKFDKPLDASTSSLYNSDKDRLRSRIDLQSFQGQYQPQNCPDSELQSLELYKYYATTEELSIGLSYKIDAGKPPFRQRLPIGLGDSSFVVLGSICRLINGPEGVATVQCNSNGEGLTCSTFLRKIDN